MIQIKEEESLEESKKTFGPNEEKAIISLAFDQPDSFIHILGHLETDYFSDYPTKIVFSLIEFHYNKHAVVLSREMCRDIALKSLTVDDRYEEILDVIDRKSNPREIPVIRDALIDFARDKAYSRLFSEEALEAHEDLFIEAKEEKLTTGFTRLDAYLNEGGPTKKEVVCWMAPTGVGKSIMLVNSSVECVRRGLNVLFVTLELSDIKTAKRHAGAFTEVPLRKFLSKQDMVREKLNKVKRTYKSELFIYEFPADDITVDTVHTLLDHLRRMEGINIDVVIIDYLELLLSRNPAANKDKDYTRQKRVATEILSLAKKENVLVFTASQTNRSGTDVQEAKSAKVIDLNKVAESYGKTMPLDYIITINQSKEEYEAGREDAKNPTSAVRDAQCRFYIAKNRNGPKFKTIAVRVDYETMKARQEEFF
jgi:replicative DNA helicase